MFLSSCEAELMAATEVAKQAIWLKELMVEIMNKEDKKLSFMAVVLSSCEAEFKAATELIHLLLQYIFLCIIV